MINQKHPFVSIVVIALMGMLAGASGPTTIAFYSIVGLIGGVDQWF